MKRKYWNVYSASTGRLLQECFAPAFEDELDVLESAMCIFGEDVHVELIYEKIGGKE